MSDTALNRVFITAAIFCIITGVLISMYAFANIKRWFTSHYRPPQPFGQEYIDVRMQKLINDKIPAASVVCDINGKILWVNDWATHILHWRRDEIIGKPFTMLIPEKARPVHERMMEEYRRTGQVEIFGKPMRLQCLQKGDIMLPTEITIVEAQDDNRVLIIAKIRDLTQQLEEFTRLQRELELFKRVEEDACLGFMSWDFVEDKVYMSNNMLNLFDLGSKDNNCNSEVLTNCVVSNDRKRVGDTIVNAVTTKANSYEIEFDLRNGRHIRLLAALEYNEGGEVTIINGVLRSLKKS